MLLQAFDFIKLIFRNEHSSSIFAPGTFQTWNTPVHLDTLPQKQDSSSNNSKTVL